MHKRKTVPIGLRSPPKLSHKLSVAHADILGTIEPRFTGAGTSNSSSLSKFLPAATQGSLQEPPLIKIKKVSSETQVGAAPSTLSKFSSHSNFETADRAFESETEEIKEDEEIEKIIKEEDVESEEENSRPERRTAAAKSTASALKKETVL